MSVMALITTLLPQLTETERLEMQQSLGDVPLRRWAKGARLFSEQQSFAHLVLIQTGLIRSFYVNDDTEVNLRFLCDGSLAVPFAALAQAWVNGRHAPLIATESLQCVTTVTGYVLPLSPLLGRTQWAHGERLRTELAARHYVSMEQRLRMIQHQRAADRYANFLCWMPAAIVAQMPNVQVASYLGITPEALSRIKAQAKR
jgi:CRP-like cAMP-binding protein